MQRRRRDDAASTRRWGREQRGPSQDDAAADGSARPRTLTLSLDPTIDLPGDDVKATSIITADLLDVSGTNRRSAIVAAGSATF
jgi:hypothetical protein